MKRGIVTLLVALLLSLPGVALAQPPQEIQDGVRSAVEGAGLRDWQSVLEGLPEGVQAIWGDKDIGALVEEYAVGEGTYLGQVVMDGIGALLQGALPQTLRLMLSLMAVALISGFVRALGDASVAGLNDVTGFVCHCFGVVIALTGFMTLAGVAREAILSTARFIELAFPTLLTLLTAARGIASAGIFQPAMTLLCGGIAVVLRDVVLPVILFGAVMAVLNNMTGRVQLGQLFKLSKTTAKWIIGFVFTLYFGITSLQGMTAASFDGVSVRTAKYALDKLIPIVGGVVSGTVDTVLGCAVLVKNAAGLAAIFIAFGLVLTPLVHIGAGIFSFRITAALCEPVADPRMPKMLGALADVLTYLFASAMALSIMFIITVGLMMRTGGMAILGG